MKKLLRANLLVWLALGLSLGAGLKARARLVDTIQEVDSLRAKGRKSEDHRNALLKVLNQVELGDTFLAAEIAVGEDSNGMILEDPHSVVLYRLSTECPHCSTNYPFLNELADSGVPVIGLAVDTTEASVRRHRTRWGVRFPILVHAHGAALSLVPRYATPTTVVISRQEVVFLEFGELEPESMRAMKKFTSGWTKALPDSPPSSEGWLEFPPTG